MLAFVYDGKRARVARDRAEPAEKAGHVRVRTLRAGICRTDLELSRGYMGFDGVLGHEFVGRAAEGRFEGRRVVGGINFACRDCPACRRGLGRHCPNRAVLGIDGADGTMAEQFIIPEANLIEVPDTLSDEQAVFAEPVAAACEILEQLPELAATETSRAMPVLVVGDGKLGPLVAQVLAAEGLEVELLGHHTDSLGWLEDHGVRLSAKAPSRALYPLVVEASGSAEGLSSAIAWTEPRGTLVVKTTVAGSHQIDLAPVVINEITMVGSRCGNMKDGLERLTRGQVSTERLIDARYPLANGDRAFERAAGPGTRKVLIEVA